jgi:hypothetical protein
MSWQSYKAIGHPARIAIIQHLIKVNSCVCGDIVNELPRTTYRIPTLKEKNAGLIKGILKETLFVVSMKKASIKYKAFFNINTYLESKKINVVNFKYEKVIRN